MLASLIYLALRNILTLTLLRCRSQEFKELEIVVLRHELGILRLWGAQTRSGSCRSAVFVNKPAKSVSPTDAA